MKFDSYCRGSRGTYWRSGGAKSGVMTHAGAEKMGCRVECYVDVDGCETMKIYLTRGWFTENEENREGDVLLSTWKLINGEIVEF